MIELGILQGVPKADQGVEVDLQAESVGRRGGDPGPDFRGGIGLKPIEEYEPLLVGEPGDEGMGAELALANSRGNETAREGDAPLSWELRLENVWGEGGVGSVRSRNLRRNVYFLNIFSVHIFLFIVDGY